VNSSRSPLLPKTAVRVTENDATDNSFSSKTTQLIIGTDIPGHVSQARNSAEALSEIWSSISSREETNPSDRDADYLLEFPLLHPLQVQAIISHVQHCQKTTSQALGLDSFVIRSGGSQAEQSAIIRSIKVKKPQLEREKPVLVDDETILSQTRSWWVQPGRQSAVFRELFDA